MNEQHNIEFGIRFLDLAAKEYGGSISIVDMDKAAWDAMTSMFSDEMKAAVKTKTFDDCVLHTIKFDGVRVSCREKVD